MGHFKLRDTVFIGILALFCLFSVWRASYGINYNDEMYYADCLNRLFQGDVYLVHDWKIHLMAFIPVYPFYALFRLLNGSNEGVILFLRLLYVGFQLVVAFVCYLRLRSMGWSSIFVCLVYLFFTPFNLAAPSYNTLGLGFAMLVFTLLSGTGEHHTWDSFFVGVFLACCILSTPFAIVLYFIYAAACAVQLFLCRRGRRKAYTELSLPYFLRVTAGAFLVFLLFLLMLFSRTSLGELLRALPYNFNLPGYEQGLREWVEKFTSYFKKIYNHYPLLVVYTGMASILSRVDKKRKEHALCYLLPASALVIWYLYRLGLQENYIPTNFCALPLAFLSFLCFCLAPEGKGRYFYFWFVPALLYSLCVHLASDTGILCITSSFILCSACGVLFLWNCGVEIWKASARSVNGIGAACCLVLALAFHLAAAGYLRLTFFYNEAPLSELTEQVTVGPGKGLYTTAGMAGFHDERVEDLQSLGLTEENTLLVMGMEPWAYLCTDAACASYTCWETSEEAIYRAYLELFPEKYPTAVYCTDYETSLQEYSFLQELLDQGYEVVTLRSATALVKPKTLK